AAGSSSPGSGKARYGRTVSCVAVWATSRNASRLMGGGIVRHGEGFPHPEPGGGPRDDQLPPTHASRMGNGTGRYAVLTKRLIDSVLGTPGHTTTELRRAVLARAFGPPSSPLPGTERGTGGEDIAPDLASYVDKVALHAYKVTDEDLVALKRAGNSDDLLFEVTVSAPLGAARSEEHTSELQSRVDLVWRRPL